MKEVLFLQRCRTASAYENLMRLPYWDITRGNSDLYYAVHVIDTRFDPSHPDLNTKLLSEEDPFTGNLNTACLLENDARFEQAVRAIDQLLLTTTP